MKYLLILLVITSCYTKKQAIKKFCEKDSISIVVRDTIITETLHTDTFFHSSIDTFTLVKDRLTIKYRKVNDTIFLEGTCLGDTIYKERIVYAKCPEPFPKLNRLEKIGIYSLAFLAILGLAMIILSRFFR